MAWKGLGTPGLSHKIPVKLIKICGRIFKYGRGVNTFVSHCHNKDTTDHFSDLSPLTLTWLCTVFSWLLKVMVRLVEVLGATWVMKGVLLWLTVSYMLTRRLQISMFWKHDFTLHRQSGSELTWRTTAETVQTAIKRSLEGVLGAVRVIEEMRHGNEGVVERFDGGDPLVSVDSQHLGQQVDELPPVCLFRQHVASFQV